jgi:hypothetical protein
MRVSVNVEFTEDELRKYAEDVGRRWVVNAIHEVITHLPALKLDPSVALALGQQFVSAFAQKPSPQQSHPQTDPGHGASGDPHIERCKRLGESVSEDGGWICCHCGQYNGAHRVACRNCQHDVCDIIVTPPPADPEPSSSTSA